MNETKHKFEIAGLGKYPFRCTAIIERSQSNGDGTTQPTGTCDFCGTGIKYCCVILSADGKRFEVGTDCVQKSDDRGLVNMVKRALRIAREEKRRAEWEAERNTPEAIAERARIDAEMAERKAKLEAERAIITREQAWLIEILAAQAGDFCQSIAQDLKGRRLDTFSPKVKGIICDVYARQAGRRNSNAYQTAVAEFETITGFSPES